MRSNKDAVGDQPYVGLSSKTKTSTDFVKALCVKDPSHYLKLTANVPEVMAESQMRRLLSIMTDSRCFERIMLHTQCFLQKGKTTNQQILSLATILPYYGKSGLLSYYRVLLPSYLIY